MSRSLLVEDARDVLRTRLIGPFRFTPIAGVEGIGSKDR
jgi:hypothetical protein